MPQRKRTIKANDIIRDLRSGMTVSQLMDKYRISLKALRFIFRRLLNAGAITNDELTAQAALYRDAAHLKGVRKWLRTTANFPVRIYDSGSPFTTGYVLNISEKGICVKGIKSAAGEVKNLIVRSGAFGEGHSFVLEGKCRWVNTEQLSGKEWVAGFEITNISNLDSGELRKLIRYVENRDLDRRINEAVQATFGSIQ
jgi:hypothetical protein